MLTRYREKRDFAATPEPGSESAPAKKAPRRRRAGAQAEPRFVVQEHHARRLHWDLRLEHDGVAVSFAIPNGIPRTPKENRLAVHTEDHPIEYLDWEGEIPAGQYGAGTMRVWDVGTYTPLLWTEQKIDVDFHGERLTGRYGLFPIGRTGADTNDWMIHRMDPAPDGWMPMPDAITPMLARAGTLPAEPERWAFEVKWDGVRALAFARPGRLRLESRNGNDITAAYPELRGLVGQLGMREALIDGEIVAFDADGRPSFSSLQRRMHVSDARTAARLAKATPVTYAIFDLLHLDGASLLGASYDERRDALADLGLDGPHWRVPATHPGEGAALLEATRAQGLEGVVAKRRDSRYTPGGRGGAWLKLKHSARQEIVIGGWLPGEGRRRDRIGALLTGYHAVPGDAQLVYAGRVGTGFTEKTLGMLASRLDPIVAPASPFAGGPKLPRNAVFVRPELVAEIEFTEWTPDGVMRAPSFKGLREDKDAADVVREGVAAVSGSATPGHALHPGGRAAKAAKAAKAASAAPAASLRNGSNTFAGRELTISNFGKVLFPETGFTKGDLIEYYAAIAPTLLPHLAGRALTLKRYPNGVDAPFFYEKNSPSHRPGWVPTARIGDVDYTLCDEPATLVWLANLADIELHTSLAIADEPQTPTMVVFDLDPGAPAGLVECCRVALVLRGLFDALGLTTVVKTSGSKGMQVYLPLNDPDVSYAQTKALARQIAELLEARLPEVVVSRMTKRLRPGRVFVDWSQNDTHKTTVCVYSVRATAEPRVSTPLSWEEVERCASGGDPAILHFTPADVIARIADGGDRFAAAAEVRQSLPAA